MGDFDGPQFEGFGSGEVSAETIKDRLRFARDNRILTGVRVIDDVFGGILPTDMVLLGAKTGVGKTGLASQIAMHNSRAGKRVYMYALEAEPEEIQMRILYEMLVSRALSHNPLAKYNYKHWRLGKYDDLDSYYDECMESVDSFKNLHVYYRKRSFTIDDFVRVTMSVKNSADLIIVDHIHYFDLDGTNENKAMSDAIKKVRDIALLTGVPVLVLAHLRKSANVQYKLVPDIDDFMGSSDLSKVCTKGVIIAPAGGNNVRASTYFSFPKFRGFSNPNRYLFKCDYDIHRNTYESTYTIANFRFNSVKFQFVENLVDPEELSWLG